MTVRQEESRNGSLNNIVRNYMTKPIPSPALLSQTDNDDSARKAQPVSASVGRLTSAPWAEHHVVGEPIGISPPSNKYASI